MKMIRTFFLGSSPHTRDKYYATQLGVPWDRIIPAYAGQIPSSQRLLTLIRDHPRIRGTNFGGSSEADMAAGSSPHTRDKYVSSFLGDDFSRIIPAYAGQIVSYLPDISETEDHPRIRGTNLPRQRRRTKRAGSSPHTRDKSRPPVYPRHDYRIIPAYAGQIIVKEISYSFFQDHPRIRGTNSLYFFLA